VRTGESGRHSSGGLIETPPPAPVDRALAALDCQPRSDSVGRDGRVVHSSGEISFGWVLGADDDVTPQRTCAVGWVTPARGSRAETINPRRRRIMSIPTGFPELDVPRSGDLRPGDERIQTCKVCSSFRGARS